MAPSCAPSASSTTEAGQQEAVAVCLERLRPGHFQAKRLAFEIRDVGFTPAGSLGTLQMLVRWIFDRAMTDPERYAAPCAALCFSLTPILPNFKPPGALTAAAKAKRIDFRQTLLNLCQREFEAACVSTFGGEATAQNGIDGAGGAGDAKPAASLSGSVQFLACLYLHHLLTDRIMLACLDMVAAGSLGGGGGGAGAGLLSGNNVPRRVECLVRALMIAGRQLDECLAEQYRPVLNGLYDQLAAHKAQSPSDLSPEVQSSLEQLLELRAGHWAAWAGVPGISGPAGAPRVGCGMVAPVQPFGMASIRSGNGCHGVSASGYGATPVGAGAAAASRLAKTGGVVVVHRSSGRIVVAAPGSATASAGAPTATAAAAPPPPQNGRSSSPGIRKVPPSETATSGGLNPAAAALRRQQQQGSSSSSSLMTMDGVWELSPDNYSEVRGQLLSQQAASSPATLEAMADELVESAVAASGGAPSCPCWGTPAGAAGDEAAAEPPLAAALTDEQWTELVQQQWDAQVAACDIYVRLCVDALQQMSTATPPAASVPTCNGGATAAAATAAMPTAANGSNVVGETGRLFRRLLLSAAQTHFERCLAALLPVQLPPSSSPDLPSPSTSTANLSAAAGSAAAAAVAEIGNSQRRPDVAADPVSGVVVAAAAAAAGAPRRDWGDMPVAAPDAAEAVPRARGICHLLLGLLRYGILTPRIVLNCAAAMFDGAAGGSVPCLQCACILLAGAGKLFDSFKVAEAAAFESLVKRLQALGDADKAAATATAPIPNGDPANGTTSGGGSGGALTGLSVEDAVLRRRFVGWLVTGLRARQ